MPTHIVHRASSGDLGYDYDAALSRAKGEAARGVVAKKPGSWQLGGNSSHDRMMSTGPAGMTSTGFAGTTSSRHSMQRHRSEPTLQDNGPRGRLATLVQANLYPRRNVFATFTENWLAGSPEYNSMDMYDQETRDERPSPWDDPAEIMRRRDLAATNQGHLAWLRARDLRAELVVQPARPPKAEPSEPSKSMPSKTMPDINVAPRASPSKDIWLRVSPVPLGIKPMAQTAGAPDPDPMCWRADFVLEALYLTDAMQIRHPIIEVASLRRVAQKNPAALEEARGRSEVVGSNGRRELWSARFLGFLEALRKSRSLVPDSPVVRKALRELSREVTFPKFDPLFELSSPSARRKKLPAPDGFKEWLRQERPAPFKPEVPVQLPYQVSYRQDELWTRLPMPGCQPRRDEPFQPFRDVSSPSVSPMQSPTRAGEDRPTMDDYGHEDDYGPEDAYDDYEDGGGDARGFRADGTEDPGYTWTDSEAQDWQPAGEDHARYDEDYRPQSSMARAQSALSEGPRPNSVPKVVHFQED